MSTPISQRIIAGDGLRKSRLHDARGNRTDARAAVRDVPLGLIGTAGRKLFGKSPSVPWIPGPAIRALDKLARPDWRLLEHGSGYSTLWWSRRVGEIRAIEANPEWHARIQSQLDKLGADHVHMELRTGPEYSDFSMFEDGSFDCMSIDGHAREVAAAEASRLLARPGWIYLDNSDFAAHWHEMYGEAEDILLDLARRENARVTYFTGLAGGTLIAGQGMLVALPRRAQE